MTKCVLVLLTACSLTFLPACNNSEESNLDISSKNLESKSAVFDPMSLTLDSSHLIKGREIWIETCSVCHLEGLGGAPLSGDSQEWPKRLDKAIKPLYSHAIEGFYGDYGEMPARGGNDSLKDSEVKSAVDFVLYASR